MSEGLGSFGKNASTSLRHRSCLSPFVTFCHLLSPFVTGCRRARGGHSPRRRRDAEEGKAFARIDGLRAEAGKAVPSVPLESTVGYRGTRPSTLTKTGVLRPSVPPPLYRTSFGPVL